MSANIYFACSITGGREDETAYQAIVDWLLGEGHQIPTAHLASPEVMHLEKVADPVKVYSRDIAWINACDALIAEISTPSHGVGYEVGYALSLSKPVLCCYREGVAVSKMILGNKDPLLQISAYRDIDMAVQLVHTFINGVISK